MNNIDAQKALERSYVSSLENKEYDEAVKLAETLCLLDPNNPEYPHKIAYVYLQQLKCLWCRRRLGTLRLLW